MHDASFVKSQTLLCNVCFKCASSYNKSQEDVDIDMGKRRARAGGNTNDFKAFFISSFRTDGQKVRRGSMWGGTCGIMREKEMETNISKWKSSWDHTDFKTSLQLETARWRRVRLIWFSWEAICQIWLTAHILRHASISFSLQSFISTT